MEKCPECGASLAMSLPDLDKQMYFVACGEYVALAPIAGSFSCSRCPWRVNGLFHDLVIEVKTGTVKHAVFRVAGLEGES